MPRLFVALDLPQAVVSQLASRQLPPRPGIKLVKPGQMHLTLHFIGEAETISIADALSSTAYSRFSLSIEGTGQFRTATGIILWAGVKSSAELTALHAEVGRRLALVGVRLDSKPFRPHITLARCSRNFRRTTLNRPGDAEPLSIPDIPIASFSLYSSVLNQQGPSYRQERCYPLAPDAYPP